MQNAPSPIRERHLSAWFFIGLLGALFISFFLALAKMEPVSKESVASVEAVLSGKTALSFEKNFNEALPFRQWAINSWGILRYALFHTGADGVVIGKDGWLFTAEEFKVEKDFDKNIERNLTNIGRASTFLYHRGIRVILVVVPSKARIYQDYLGESTIPEARRKLISRFQKTNKPFPVVNGEEVLREAMRKQPVFLKLDTHWTPYGAQAIANKTAETIRKSCPNLRAPEVAYVTREKQVTLDDPDLARFIPVGPFATHYGFDQETIASAVTEPVEGESDLFGGQKIVYALLGTSYSAIEDWNFEGYLKQALQADVLNLADQGEGPMAPMQKFLDEGYYKQTDIKVVIWEFPERFLPVDYGEISLPVNQPYAPRLKICTSEEVS